MATLYDLAQAYLNRGLPDISGIFGDNTNNTLAPIDFGGEEPVSPQGLTPEQLALLYSQYNNVGGDGGENDNNNDFTDGRATNNAGINSFSDLSGITGIGTLGNLASYALGGIPGVIGNNIIGAGITGLKDLIGGNGDRDTSGTDVGGTGTTAAKDTSMGETGYGSCFIAGTKVTMGDGTFKNIEDVVVGDKVKGHKENNEVIKLDPTLLGDRKLYSFNDNEHYFFTSEHPFMTEEGWKSIKPEKTKERDGVELYNQLEGELKIGDKLVTDKGLIEITDIRSKEINNSNMPLYNFNVSNDNSYIADDYVVHNKGGRGTSGMGAGMCFDPKTPIQMADGSTKEIKDIQLGDDTKGGEVTGVFQFKAADEIHDYKGVTVAGSHFVKEDDKFIMVKDSPLAVKIDKIPVVYSLDTSGRRIFINDIEFADYNGDGVAKNFLNNAGVDLTGFDKEVLRQVEHRLI